MAERKPIPKSQKQISIDQHIPTSREGGNPNLADNSNSRGTQLSWKDDTIKPLTIGIQDIDEAVFFYFKNIIQPTVTQNGELLPVPVIYGSPEKWKSYQKDGYYRDQKGKIMAPLILIKRNNIEKVRSITNKLDANSPNNYNVFGSTYSKQSAYDQFAVLNNRKPQKIYYASVVPDYIKLTYECVAFTYYVEQLNKIVEAMEYASDAYWGNPERFQFNARIDSFNFETSLQEKDERIIKSTFNINLNGYLLPDVIQRNASGIKKYVEKSKLIFSLETDMPPAFYDGVQNGDRIVTPTTNEQIGDATDAYSKPNPEFTNSFDNSFD